MGCSREVNQRTVAIETIPQSQVAAFLQAAAAYADPATCRSSSSHHTLTAT